MWFWFNSSLNYHVSEHLVETSQGGGIGFPLLISWPCSAPITCGSRTSLISQPFLTKTKLMLVV